MAIPIERIEELLHLMREVDLPTLRALDHKLHLLLIQKEIDRKRAAKDADAQTEFCQHYPHIAIEPALFALVGMQPENPIDEDKRLIREQIFRRLTE
jgi:hypothetical protein